MLDTKVARLGELLTQIGKNFAPAAFANSFGAEDMVLTDLIAREFQAHHAIGATAVEGIVYRLNVNTLERETGVSTFQLNDIGRVRLKTVRPLTIDAYHVTRETGSLILIDEVSNETVAGGMIVGEEVK